MVKDSGGAAVRLTSLIAEIEAEAYARGRTDARQEVLSALGVVGKPAPTPRSRRQKPSSTGTAGKRRAGGGKRAPKGTVRALVERALRDRPGLTARDILGRADSDAERLVKPGSIRAELQTGRKQDRYRSEGGRWSLASSSSAEGDRAPDAPSSPEPDDAAGASADSSLPEAGPPAAPREDVASDEPGTGMDRDSLGMNR